MPETEKQYLNFTEAFASMQKQVHQNAINHGWHDTPREDGTALAMIHSEVSEALEELRKGNPLDTHIPEYTGAEAELADVIIRIMDLAELRGWDITKAIVAKHNFNTKRPYKHGGKRF